MSRFLLMQSILGHMALLAEKYPRKAASKVAREAKRAVKLSLHAPSATSAATPARTYRRAA